MLDLSWYFGCICIEWHWRCLCKMGWTLELFPGNCLICGCLHWQPRETILSSASYDWIVDVFAWILRWISRIILKSTTPSNFAIFLKGYLPRIYSGLEVIIFFGFTDFGVLWFLLIQMAGSRRVLDRIFHDCCFFISRVGYWLEFAVLVFFIFSFHVYLVPFIFLLGKSLSN